MPTLQITIKRNNVALKRAYIEHLILGIPRRELYMTDDKGRIRDEDGNLGVSSGTDYADLRVLCQNTVVKVLNGNTVGPLAVHHDFFHVKDGQEIDLQNTTGSEKDHYNILDRALCTYDVIFRQFRPFSDNPRPEFALGRKDTLRATMEQAKRIDISYPSHAPFAERPWTEPKSLATEYPLVHLMRLESLFGSSDTSPTMIASEVGHALHFSLFSTAGRGKIETLYGLWLATDKANGGDASHFIGKRTSPEVAYLEALDHFSHRFSEYVRQVVQGDEVKRLRLQGVTEAMRRDFVEREARGDGVIGRDVSRLDASGRPTPQAVIAGPDDEGAVYGCIFVDFARSVGLRTAVSAYLRSASAQAASFGEYKDWIREHQPEHLPELTEAQARWGL